MKNFSVHEKVAVCAGTYSRVYEEGSVKNSEEKALIIEKDGFYLLLLKVKSSQKLAI